MALTFSITTAAGTTTPTLAPQVESYRSEAVLSDTTQYASSDTQRLYTRRTWTLRGTVSAADTAAVRTALNAISQHLGRRATSISLGSAISLANTSACTGYPRMTSFEEGISSEPQYGCATEYRMTIETLEPRTYSDTTYENEYTIEVSYDAGNMTDLPIIRKTGRIRTKTGTSALKAAQYANLNGYQLAHYRPSDGEAETLTVSYSASGASDWTFPLGRNGSVRVLDPGTDTLAEYTHEARKLRFQLSGLVREVPRRTLRTTSRDGHVVRVATASVSVDSLDTRYSVAESIAETLCIGLIPQDEWTSQTSTADYATGTYSLEVEAADVDLGDDLSLQESLTYRGGERGRYAVPLCGDQRPRIRLGAYQPVTVVLEGTLVTRTKTGRAAMLASLASSYGQKADAVNHDESSTYCDPPTPQDYDLGRYGDDERKTTVRSWRYRYRVEWLYAGGEADAAPEIEETRVDPRTVGRAGA